MWPSQDLNCKQVFTLTTLTSCSRTFAMRPPQERYRIGGESIREIVRELRAETNRLRDLDIQATKRALEQAHVVNAILLYFLGKDPIERERIARAAVARYRQHLDSEAPLPIEPIILELLEGTTGRSAPKGGVAATTGKIGQQRKPKRKNSSSGQKD